MDDIKTITPIAFWKTRSFWLGWFPAALTLLDSALQLIDTPAAVPVANALAMILSAFGADMTGDDIAVFMKTIAPVYALIVAQQRGGLTRPYTASPSKEREIIRVIEDGKSAFEAGNVLGSNGRSVDRLLR